MPSAFSVDFGNANEPCEPKDNEPAPDPDAEPETEPNASENCCFPEPPPRGDLEPSIASAFTPASAENIDLIGNANEEEPVFFFAAAVWSGCVDVVAVNDANEIDGM